MGEEIEIQCLGNNPQKREEIVKQSFEGGFEGCVKYFTTGEGKENLTAQSGKTREESAHALCAYIGRKQGKIAADDTADVATNQDTESLQMLVDLVSKMATKLDELTAKLESNEQSAQTESTEEMESAVKKALNDEGFTKIEGNNTVNNLPNTKKTSGGISDNALKNMPWAEVHQLAHKRREEE